MTNCLFYSIIFTLFLTVSIGSLRFSQVNRCFMSIYKGMLEASVITVDDNGESTVPYYDKEVLSNYVTTYFENNIKNYVKEYQIDIDYLDDEEKSREVMISLRANINYLFKYEKSRTFTVMSKDEL